MAAVYVCNRESLVFQERQFKIIKKLNISSNRMKRSKMWLFSNKGFVGRIWSNINCNCYPHTLLFTSAIVFNCPASPSQGYYRKCRKGKDIIPLYWFCKCWVVTTNIKKVKPCELCCEAVNLSSKAIFLHFKCCCSSWSK